MKQRKFILELIDMSHYPIVQLLEQIRPYQLRILERLLDEFEGKSGVLQIFVRGSISNGLFDKSSDTDFAIVVADEVFPQYLRIMDDLMFDLGAVLPGWPDKIVPPFGGAGLVYLLRAPDGQVFQTDVYIAPSSTANFSSIRRGEITRLFPHPDDSLVPCNEPDCLTKKRVCDQIDEFWNEKDTVISDFVSVCVHSIMVLKRIQRATFWLNMSNSVGLLESIRQLLRRKYSPELRAYGWYKFSAIVRNERSQEYALGLKTLANQLLPEATFASVEEAFVLSVSIMETCFPEQYQEIRIGSDFILETIRRYSLSLN